MTAALIVFVPLFLGAIFVYIRFRPKVDASLKAALGLFDCALILFLAAVDLGLALHFKTEMDQTVDRAWWPVLAALSCLLMDAVILFYAVFIRKIAFRRK